MLNSLNIQYDCFSNIPEFLSLFTLKITIWRPYVTLKAQADEFTCNKQIELYKLVEELAQDGWFYRNKTNSNISQLPPTL